MSGISYNIGGDIGFNQTQGVNSTGGGGITISNSKTIAVPALAITNGTSFPQAFPNWSYNINDLPTYGGTSMTVYDQWIWQVPFSAYYGGATSITYFASAGMTVNVNGNSYGPGLQINPVVPLPFGRTFSLQPPVVTGLSSYYVDEGNTFTIKGSGFYPSLVQSVLIGGTPLTSSQYKVLSDKQIEVVAPFLGFYDSVVVQTSQGTSNDNYHVTIY